jgi:tRNA nucleotidyltransferase (CCA-adding enzyme)
VDTGVHLMLVLDECARAQAPLPVRWACLCHDLGKGTTRPEEWPRHIAHESRSAQLAAALAERLRVPTECRELADVVAREHTHIHASGALGSAALVRLFERCDALRKPVRFDQVLLACACDARGRTGLQDRPYAPQQRLPPLLAAARGIDTAAVAELAASRGKQGPEIGAAVRDARVTAVENELAAHSARPAG